MKGKQGITLVELIVVVVLVAGLIVGVSAVEISFYKMKTGTLDKQIPAIQGNLALATIFERVLRAGSLSQSNEAFIISADNKMLEYKRGNSLESFYLDGQDLKYKSGNTEKVILRNVQGLRFSKEDSSGRLIVEMSLTTGDNFRSSVQPRNQFTIQSTIN
jgi:Na+-transporting NADH:ubiquinone oxidoreductase subunit NqrC